MIIDIHGHYTTAPQPLKDYRARQIEALKTPLADSFEEEIKISDDQIRESLEKSQLNENCWYRRQNPVKENFQNHGRWLFTI